MIKHNVKRIMKMELKQLDYNVYINGAEIPLFRVNTTFTPDHVEQDGSCYGIAGFDSDEPVDVEIRCARSLAATTILPEHSIPNVEITEDKISFRLEKHGSYVFQPQTRIDVPLVLFFNPVEKDAPAPDASGVHYYGPGVHSPGRIVLHSNETLYLASGAIVEAAVWAEGDNITICGHGILTQRSLKRLEVRHCLDFYKCDHVVLRDFITTDPCGWNVVFRDSHNILMDSVKVCGGRMLNDDGVDICNSTDITIRNCFIRALDDIIATKGLLDMRDLFQADHEVIKKAFEPDRRGVWNVLVEDCVFWCDDANVFRIGYECIGETMANITVRNCEIIHICFDYRSTDQYWCAAVWSIQPSHRMTFRDLLFEDLHIHVNVSDLVLAKIVSMECPPWVDFGGLQNCTFRNIALTGAGESFRGEILIAGHDADRMMKDIHFENVTINGKRIDVRSEHITIGDFTENVTFS